ncbi:NAD(P)-dependent oxidoreductase [Nodosilinea nodulosa]|uniref:NAD(P)-dependent oxidoreductase n=1 Tax=Nodosilinea nodulosa TaxID=416001 RepID=UPI00037BBA6B|nr:NAD(P)-dependent oxidoreductase [Nodosilinea nodulosa]
MKVGFIGLGNMGQGMAHNLLRAGHHLTVYNRTRSAADSLAQAGATVADSAAAAAQGVEVLITMLADDEAVSAVIFGHDAAPGALSTLSTEAVHVSMSTVSVALSQRLAAAHAAANQAYLAAPVFGRPEAAAAAKLWVIAAGATEQIDRCRPLFDAIAQGVFAVGDEPWTANVVKVAGNFMIFSMLEALGESFALMQKSGVSPELFLDIINTALFKSPIYQNYGSIVVQQRYEPAGFKLKLGLKDVRLAIAAAEEAVVPMPLASLIRDHFLAAIARGDGEIDMAAIARVSEVNAGLSTGPRQGE